MKKASDQYLQPDDFKPAVFERAFLDLAAGEIGSWLAVDEAAIAQATGGLLLFRIERHEVGRLGIDRNRKLLAPACGCRALPARNSR